MSYNVSLARSSRFISGTFDRTDSGIEGLV